MCDQASGGFRHRACCEIARATKARQRLPQQADFRADKVSEMQQTLETAEVAPTIIALQEHLQTIRQTELERLRRRQVSFRPDQQAAIEELARGIVAKILHGPETVLEAVSTGKEPAALLSIVGRIFDLDVPLAGWPQ